MEKENLKSSNIVDLENIITKLKELTIEKISKEGGYLFLNYNSLETLLCLYSNNCCDDSLIFFENENFSTFQELLKENKVKLTENNLDINWDNLENTVNFKGNFLANLAYLKEASIVCKKHLFYVFSNHVFNPLELNYLNEIISLKLPITFIYLEYKDDFYSNKLENSFYYFRKSDFYQNLKDDFKNNLNRFELGANLYNKTKNIKDIIKSSLVGEKIFKKLGLNYLLVNNGDDFKDVKKSLSILKNKKETNILHIMLQKKQLSYGKYPNDFCGYVKPFNLMDGISKFETKNNLDILKLIYDDLKNKEDYMIICDFESFVDNSSINSFYNLRKVDVFEIVPIIRVHKNNFRYIVMLEHKNVREFIVSFNQYFENKSNLDIVILISNERNNDIAESNFSDLYYLSKNKEIKICHAKDLSDLKEIFNFSIENNGIFAIRFNNYALNKNYQKRKNNMFFNWQPVIYNENNKITILSYGELVNFLEKTLLDNHVDANLINCHVISEIDEDFLKKIEIMKHKIIIYGLDYNEYSIFNKIVYYNIGREVKLNIISVDNKIGCYKNYKELIDLCNKRFQNILKEE